MARTVSGIDALPDSKFLRARLKTRLKRSSDRFSRRARACRATMGTLAIEGRSDTAMRLPSATVLLVADLFHPIDILAVERFRNGDMRHRGCRCRAVPV